MGKKTNPTILRLNKTSIQKSKYLEKKSSESSLQNFRSHEIEKFIKQFFMNHGFMIHDLKLCFFNNKLGIFISYFSTLKTDSILVDEINKRGELKPKRNKKIQNLQTVSPNLFNLLSEAKKQHVYNKLNFKRIIKNELEQQTNKQKNVTSTIAQNINNHIIYNSNSYQNIANIKSNSFLQKFFEGLSLFTKNRLNFFLTFKQLNTSINHQITNHNKKILNKKLVKLRRYKESKFFKEGINVMFLAITKQNSAKLLAEFIATELQKLKKHNFFIRFIKDTLTLFYGKTFSKVKGIKIKISGRFNRSRRARGKILKIGSSVPILRIRSKINYDESTSFTSNGTLGIKVWICEKTN